MVRADKPLVVTKTEYVTLDDTLIAAVEGAQGFLNVWGNGGMYGALAHDSRWLDTCKAQIDGIRAAYAAWKTGSSASPKPPTQ